MNNKQWIFAALLVFLVAVAWLVWRSLSIPKVTVTDFNSCAATGQPVMESYPRMCRYGNQTFTEDIGNELDKVDIIRVNSPRPNAAISSPLNVAGEAVGNWYFEASFPIKLFDADNNLLAEDIAKAQSDWMTSDFVPFTATLSFTAQPANSAGTLILYRDNPSGLPQNDDSLIIPVMF